MQTTIKGLLLHMKLKERTIRGLLEFLVEKGLATVASNRKGPMGRPVLVYDISDEIVGKLSLVGEVV